MAYLYTVAGCALLVAATLDLVWSTLSVAGGGPFTRLLGRAVWHLSGRSKAAGPLILIGTSALWVVMLWTGWSLVFMGATDAVVNSTDRSPGDVWDRIYFSGYTVATLGLGDYVPQGPVWRLLTVMSAGSGLVLITLGVTYYSAVVSAVVEEQQFALLVDSLGESPADILVRAWNGDGFSGLDTILPTLAGMIAIHARRHYAYPVLHYFRPGQAKHCPAVQIARLTDALLLLEHVVARRCRPPPAALNLIRRSLQSHLNQVHPRFVSAAAEPPPPPDSAALRRAGIPFEDSDSIFATDDIRRERRILLGYLSARRFEWPDVDPKRVATRPA